MNLMKIKKMKIKQIAQISFIVFVLLTKSIAQAQESQADSMIAYTLEEIQQYAVENNYEAINSQLDIEIAKKQKWETTAIGLPNVSASGEYQNFPDIPTQLMPDFISPAIVGVNRQVFGLTPIAPVPEGGKMPVQFGSEHNTTYGISVSQLIFSGEYFVGLKASRIYLELSKTAHKRKKEEVKETVSKTYYLILITEETINALDSVYAGLLQLQNETEQLADAGFIDDTDARQVELNVKNTENNLSSVKQQRDILYRMLKFQAGIDYNKQLQLESDLETILVEINTGQLLQETYDIYADTDFKLMQVQESLTDLELQREKSTVLPKLSAFFSYSENNMADELDLFSDDAQWYPTTVWGFNLSVPIFSSGSRWARIKQKEIKLEQTSNQKEMRKQALMLDYEQTRSNYLSTYNNFRNAESSKELSQKIYNNSLIKYKEGTISGLELTQAQNQHFMAIGDYYKNLSDLTEVHIKLKRILKQL
jgi:outer membrane protein TolC